MPETKNAPRDPNKDRERKSTGKNSGDPINKVWDTLKSMKFAILLLLVITALTVMNLFANEFIVPVQGEGAGAARATYDQAYGEPRATILTVMQMYDPYSSWWYTTLLGLLTLSLLVCVIDRASLVWKLVTGSRFLASPSQYTGHGHNETLSGDAGLKDRLLEALKKAGYRVKTKDTGKALLLHGQKQAIAHSGAWIVHVGFILLVIGGALIARGEFRHTAGGWPGEFIASQRYNNAQLEQLLGFNIRVDAFEVHYYELREGQYVGLDNERQIGRITAENKDGSFDVEILWPQRGFQENVTADRLKNRIDRRFSGSRLDQANISDYVATLTVLENGEEILTEKIEVNDPLRYGGYRFYQSSYSDRRVSPTGEWTTYLEIRRDSGSPFVWAGIIVVSIGLMLGLYLSPRDIWARIETAETADVKAFVAGSSKGRGTEFEYQFRKILAKADPSQPEPTSPVEEDA